MVTLQLAVDSQNAVQGTGAIARELERMGRVAQDASQRVDQLEGNLSQFAKEMEASRKAAEALQNENRRLSDQLRNTQQALQGGADKAAQFQRAAGALNEVSQVGQRVRLLGEEVRNLGSGFSTTSGVLNTFALGLTDIAQISSKASGGFGGLVTLLRANPLLAAAGVLTAIATAMGLFGDKTSETNDKLKQQVDLLDQIRQSQQTFRERARLESANLLLGIESKPGERERTIALALRDEALRLGNAGGAVPLSELAKVLGEAGLPTRRNYVAELMELGAPRSALTFRPGLGQTFQGQEQPVDITGRFVEQYLLEQARIQLEAARKLEASSQSLENAVQRSQQPGGAGGQDIVATLTGEAFGPPVGPGGRRFTPEEVEAIRASRRRPSDVFRDRREPEFAGVSQADRLAQFEASTQRSISGTAILTEAERKAAFEQAKQELIEFEERFENLKSLGADVGTAVGNAFFSITNGAASARQALAALLQQFVAIAQQRAVAGFANAVSNSFGSLAGQRPAGDASGVAAGQPVVDPRN
jgi:hypothetical protein